MTVLVTGATGNVGSQVVRELQVRGVPVRGFVRDPGSLTDVELAIGDFADPASIRRALVGVDRVFLSSADGPDKVSHEAAVIDAAAAAGVELIVKASTMLAEVGSPLKPLDWNGRSEQNLTASGVPAVILASSFYMTNLLAAAGPLREQGVLPAPAGDGAVAMIDPRDVAAVAAVALIGDGRARADLPSDRAGTDHLRADRGDPRRRVRRRAAGRGAVRVRGGRHARLAGRPPRRRVRAHPLGRARRDDQRRPRPHPREPRDFAAFARDHATVFARAASVG